MECLFCKIANGEIASSKIYEDEKVLVFLDIYPEANGHMLVIPKEHYINISDIDVDILKHMYEINKKMYQLIKEKLKADGLTIYQNNDSAQDIKHFHMHLIPRWKNDNVEHIFSKDRLIKIDEVYKILIQK